MFKKLLGIVGEINPHDDATIERLVLKATEELGELAEAINWKNNYKNTEKSPEDIDNSITEEAIDVIICMIAILEKNGATPEHSKEYFKKKTKKWKKNLQKRKNNTTFDENIIRN